MNKRVRLLCVTLVSLMVLSQFMGCGPKVSEELPMETATSSPSSGEGEQDSAKDEIVDMEEYVFTFASAWMRSEMSDDATLQEHLFFERINQVENDYNVEIEIINFYADQNNMLPRIMAQDKIADVIDMMPTMWIPAAKTGQIRPWEEVDNIDINDARWVKAYTDMSALEGKHWGLQYIRPPEVRATIFYNRDLLKRAGIEEDPQQLVKEGNWTYEKMREMAIATTKDWNNDGTIDTYGVLSNDTLTSVRSLVAANGGRLVTLDGEGKGVASFNDPKVRNALSYYNTLVNSDRVVKVWDHMRSEETWNNTVPFEDVINEFREGNIAFFITESWVANQHFNTVADTLDYGILPLPKGPDAEDYASLATHSRVFTMTTTNDDSDKSAIIFNALAKPLEGYEGEDWWLEEIEVEYFRAGDKESVNLYRDILNRSVIDLGAGVEDLWFDFVHTAIAAPVFWQEGTTDSSIESMQGMYDEQIDAIFNR